MDTSVVRLTHLRTFYNSNIIGVEHFSDLHIPTLIPFEDGQYSYVNVWSDDVEDERVLYLDRAIGSRCTFHKSLWLRGVDEYPVIVPLQPSKKGNNSRKGFPGNTYTAKEKGKGKVDEEQSFANGDQKISSTDMEEVLRNVDAKNDAHITLIKELIAAHMDETKLLLAAHTKETKVLLATHTKEMKELLVVEKKLMKDGILDEILSAMRQGTKFTSPIPSPDGTKEPFDHNEAQTNVGGPTSVLENHNKEAWVGYNGVPNVLQNLRQYSEDLNVILSTLYRFV